MEPSACVTEFPPQYLLTVQLSRRDLVCDHESENDAGASVLRRATCAPACRTFSPGSNYMVNYI